MEAHEGTVRSAIKLSIMIEEDCMEVFPELNSRKAIKLKAGKNFANPPSNY